MKIKHLVLPIIAITLYSLDKSGSSVQIAIKSVSSFIGSFLSYFLPNCSHPDIPGEVIFSGFKIILISSSS